jgi:cytochrome P450
VQDAQNMSNEQAAYLVGSLLEAGSDTTCAILASFMPAMLVHPDVQRRAQAELDQAVGHMRLPHTQDAGKMLEPTKLVREQVFG